MDTLILNTNGQPTSFLPLSTEHWKDAIKLIYADRVSIIAEYEDWEVHSPSITMKVPSVILLKDYVKVSRNIQFCRENVLLRDEYTCQYCHQCCADDHQELTMDHVIPRFHGGRTNFTNIVSACYSCNLEKGHYMRMRPAMTPKKPTYYELVNKRKKREIQVPDASWAEFLGWDPELVKVVSNRHNCLY
jgi:5-methylcytosine-specific restriction endonuclease McrA